MNSLSFNGIDLGQYGLIVHTITLPVILKAEVMQLPHKGIVGKSFYAPKYISLNIYIQGSSFENLIAAIDSVTTALNTDENAQLILDSISDRYWLARLDEMKGRFLGPHLWQADVDFLCPDPAAYSVAEIEAAGSVGSFPYIFPIWFGDEKTLAVGGSASTWPVFIMTVNDTIAQDTEISIENETTGEELIYTVPAGGLVATDVLEIDCRNQIVYFNDVASMSTVSGKFPSLIVGSNTLQFTNFTGYVEITYRHRYL